MKIMNCPLNGPRNIAEFVCGGEVRGCRPDRCADSVGGSRVHAGQPSGRSNGCTPTDRVLVHRPARHAHRWSGDDDGARVHGAAGAGLRWRNRRRRAAGPGLRPADRPEPARRNHLRAAATRASRATSSPARSPVRPVAAVALVQIPSPARHSVDGRARRQHAGQLADERTCCRPPRIEPGLVVRARTTAARSPTTAARRCACSAACPSASTIGRFTGRRARGSAGSRSSAASPGLAK